MTAVVLMTAETGRENSSLTKAMGDMYSTYLRRFFEVARMLSKHPLPHRYNWSDIWNLKRYLSGGLWFAVTVPKPK